MDQEEKFDEVLGAPHRPNSADVVGGSGQGARSSPSATNSSIARSVAVGSPF